MKLKYILPVATIASTAAIAAPIVTSCSCASTINLDFYDNMGPDSAPHALRNEKGINISKDKWYDFTINLANWQDKESLDEMWRVVACDLIVDPDKSDYESIIIEDAKVSVDGKELEKVEMADEGADQFSIIPHDGHIIIFSFKSLVESKNIKLSIKFGQAKDNQYIYFAIGE